MHFWPVGLDCFKELAVKLQVLLLDISDLFWERGGGGKANESPVKSCSYKRRNKTYWTVESRGLFACLHVKGKMKSGTKEEVALNLAKNELFNCCGRRRKYGVQCVFLTGEIQQAMCVLIPWLYLGLM